MSHQLNLASIDVDGAVRETAAEAMDALDGDTRSQFLRRAGIAGGAVIGGGALLGALAPSAMAFSTGDRPPAKFGKGDLGILNYALTLEYLESSFYNEATANQRRNAFLTSPQARVFLKTVTDDENQHVKALKKVLGKHAIKKPKFDFHGDNASQAKFLEGGVHVRERGRARILGPGVQHQGPEGAGGGAGDRDRRGASRISHRPDSQAAPSPASPPTGRSTRRSEPARSSRT